LPTEKYDETAEREGLQLAKVESGSDKENRKVAKEIRAFLGQFFEEEENDSVADYMTAIKEGLGNFFLIRDKDNKISAFMNSQSAKVETADGTSAEQLVVWYVVTDEKYRGQGLATKLYESAYTTALAQAKGREAELTAIVGETDPDAETFFNAMGRKRLYYKNAEGNLKEMPYLAPPSESDEDPSPEHFMARFLDDRNTTSTEEATKLVEGIYGLYTLPQYYERMSADEEAEYKGTVQKSLDLIKASLTEATDGKVYLYTAEEREALQKEGQTFIEFEDSSDEEK
jgi:GNAT superfamily N-acetyltransferase